MLELLFGHVSTLLSTLLCSDAGVCKQWIELLEWEVPLVKFHHLATFNLW